MEKPQNDFVVAERLRVQTPGGFSSVTAAPNISNISKSGKLDGRCHSKTGCLTEGKCLIMLTAHSSTRPTITTTSMHCHDSAVFSEQALAN